MEIDSTGALALERLQPVDLTTALTKAALLERVDRKYLVPLDVVHELVGRLAESHRLLSVSGRQATHYRTTYFDTPSLQCVHDHVQRRRRRFKARSRLYVEDQECRLEVKTKSPRGGTVKKQLNVPAAAYGSLTAEHREFIRATLAKAEIAMPENLDRSLELTCTRATLIDLTHGVRVTLDTEVTSHRGAAEVALDPNHVIVETKGTSRVGLADLLLREAGYRPRPFSKYAATGSLLEPSISDNAVRPLVGTQLHRQGAI